jgi:hypothetical protein
MVLSGFAHVCRELIDTRTASVVVGFVIVEGKEKQTRGTKMEAGRRKHTTTDEC